MKSLEKVSRRFDQYCLGLDMLVAYALKLQPSEPRIAKTIVSFCVIRLHDQWNARCRELVLKSATGRVLTSQGAHLARAVRGNPLEALRKKWGKKVMDQSWEPDWHIPGTTIRAAS